MNQNRNAIMRSVPAKRKEVNVGLTVFPSFMITNKFYICSYPLNFFIVCKGKFRH